MLRVVFIEQFFYPEGWGGAQLPRDVTMHFARAAMDVEVICGGDQYAPVDGQFPDDPRDAGVSITRVPRLIGGDIQTLKLIRQVWFYFAAFPLLLFRRSPDIFITQANPPLVVPMVAVAALIHRRPYLIIAQDIYPEVMFAHGMMRRASIAGRAISRLFRWAYGRARNVVSLGPTMSARLLEKGVAAKRIVCISNWSTGDNRIVRGDDNRLRAEWGLQGKFVILYSGNLGISHDVETPILAVREVLKSYPDVRLVFVGKGSRLAEAEQLAHEIRVEHAVQFRSFAPFVLLPHSLGLADAALVTLRSGFEGLVVPSKALGYLARGVPTLYVGPKSDIQQLLEQSGAGRCFAGSDTHGLAAELSRLVVQRDALNRMGEDAKRFYDAELARPIALARYGELLLSATGQSETAT